jgi:ABC-2 type transport system permease protein
MSDLWAIARREVGSLFRVPAGWIILAVFLLTTGVVFALGVLQPGQPASMRTFFSLAGWLLLPVAPAITMRAFAEEARAGTFETLAATPISSTKLVLGKYTGALLFMLAMFAPTLLFALVLRSVSSPAPDWGPIAAGYLCLLLFGALCLAIGTLCSAGTSNVTLAFLLALFATLGLMLADGLSSYPMPAPVRAIIAGIALPRRIGDFAKGVIDSSHIVFFLAATGTLLGLAALLVHARRTR